MTFPIELEKVPSGLTFKLREGSPIPVNATPLGEPFDMTFEDRPYGNRDLYGGRLEERYGNFGEQMDEEIAKRGLDPTIANSYLALGPEREVSKEQPANVFSSLLRRRPRVLSQKIQLYSIDEKVAVKQRQFTAEFVLAWAGK